MPAYDAEWEKQKYQELAPEIEAMVKQAFPHSRGARFGAQGSILAKRLANLRIEIAKEAAKKNFEVEETRRKEEASIKRDREHFERLQGVDVMRRTEAQNERERERARAELDRYEQRRREDEQRKENIRLQLGLKYGMPKDLAEKYGITPENSPQQFTEQPGKERGFTPGRFDPLLSTDKTLRGQTGFGSPEKALSTSAPQLGYPGQAVTGEPPRGTWVDHAPKPGYNYFEPHKFWSSATDSYDYGGGKRTAYTKPGGRPLYPEEHKPGTETWRELMGNKSDPYIKGGNPYGVQKPEGSGFYARPSYDFSAEGRDRERRNLYRSTDDARYYTPRTGGKSQLDPYTPGRPTDYYKRDLYSGDVSPRGFKKTYRDTKRTFKDLYQGFSF